MDVSSVTNESGAAKSAISLADDLDTFLTLLTEQLKNQDPLDPADTNEFTRQLVDFAGVEQQIQQNDHLETLIALQLQSDTATAASYIGKHVMLPIEEATLTEHGARWAYALPESSESTVLEVRDQDGELVYTADGEITPGRHEFIWDGLDDNGDPVAPGLYTLSVTATKPGGGEGEGEGEGGEDGGSGDLDVIIGGYVFVDSIEFSSQGANVTFNGRAEPVAAILAIRS